MSFSLPTTNDLQDEAMAVAEGAAKAAFGTRFKRVPRALFSKLSLPVLSVLAVFAFVFGTAVDATRRWGEHRATNGRFPVTNAFVHDGSEALSVVHARASEFRPLSFWSVTAHERALTLTTALAACMYLCCVYRDPGRVPAGYAPDPESARLQGALVELKRKGGSRFCKKCARAKPPRAHHCRQCNRCVLRMDHHCVWVNNCVGHRNYKSFFLFLFYAVVSIWHAVALLAARAVAASGFASDVSSAASPRKDASASESGMGVGEIAALTLAAPLAVALTLLFAWHCYLVSRNKTTIEHYEGVRAAASGAEAGAGAHAALPPLHALDGEAKHPYSLGLRANQREILGPRVLCWLAPGCSVAGDGLAFANVAEYGKWKRARARKEEELTLG